VCVCVLDSLPAGEDDDGSEDEDEEEEERQDQMSRVAVALVGTPYNLNPVDP
jgi:hypothetical protein